MGISVGVSRKAPMKMQIFSQIAAEFPMLVSERVWISGTGEYL